MWRATPSGQDADVAYRHITHPTYPESASAAGQISYDEAMSSMLAGWNDALEDLRTAAGDPEVEPAFPTYGTALDPERDLAPIPERDLPAGLPTWMRSLDAWAERSGADTEEKRATIVGARPADPATLAHVRSFPCVTARAGRRRGGPGTVGTSHHRSVTAASRGARRRRGHPVPGCPPLGRRPRNGRTAD